MDSTKTPPDPFNDVREAFADLGTSEKAAFVLEATFETLSQALAETGRRAAAVIDDLDIDSWFDTRAAWDMGAPPPPPAAAPPASKPEPPAAAVPPPTSPSEKTAGKEPRRRPPTDDEA